MRSHEGAEVVSSTSTVSAFWQILFGIGAWDEGQLAVCISIATNVSHGVRYDPPLKGNIAGIGLTCEKTPGAWSALHNRYGH